MNWTWSRVPCASQNHAYYGGSARNLANCSTERANLPELIRIANCKMKIAKCKLKRVVPTICNSQFAFCILTNRYVVANQRTIAYRWALDTRQNLSQPK